MAQLTPPILRYQREHRVRASEQRGHASTAHPRQASIIALQRSAGNRVVTQLLGSGAASTAPGGVTTPPAILEALRAGGLPLDPTTPGHGGPVRARLQPGPCARRLERRGTPRGR